MKGETIMDKQLPAIYNDPYISEYFKILYEEHKENKINETKNYSIIFQIWKRK